MVYVTGLSRSHPFSSLNAALTSVHVRAEDTLWLTESYYSGNSLTGILKGSSERPIIVKPIAGLRPRISGTIDTSTIQYVEFHNLEFYYDWDGSRSDYLKDTAPGRMTLVGTGVKFINCVFHDITQVTVFSNTINSEFYGCLFYNNGIGGTDWNKVHNLYTQSNAGTTKVYDTCIFLDGVSQFTIHNYSENGQLNGFTYRNCIIAGSGIALFGGVDADLLNFLCEDNFFAITTRFGYQAGDAENEAIVRNNFFGNGKTIEVFNHTNFEFTGNVCAWRRPFYLYPRSEATQPTSAYLINNNQYANISNDLRFSRMYADTMIQEEFYNLASWQADEGHDIDSTQENTAADYDRVVVYPNSYDSEKAHVAIANAASASTVLVDLSAISGLEAGDTVTVRNAQDYYNDSQSLVLNGSKQITVAMTGRSVAAPDGLSAPASLYPAIGVFVLEKA